VTPPYFARGLRVGELSESGSECVSTRPTTLPVAVDLEGCLRVDFDLVPTEAGEVSSPLLINGGHATTLTATVEAISECVPDAVAACLQQERFKARVQWRTNQGTRGVGALVPVESNDSALFYFFSPDNWELLLKVLNACGSFDHFWVFAAATTNVEYTITVVDTQTDEVKSYFKPSGAPAPAITDTRAFDTCP
jgi:hypothetical protein